jgi:hypothetical protein
VNVSTIQFPSKAFWSIMLRDKSGTRLFQLMILPFMFLLHPMKIRKESVGLGKAPQIVMHTKLALCPEIGMIQFINIEMDITICIRTWEMP